MAEGTSVKTPVKGCLEKLKLLAIKETVHRGWEYVYVEAQGASSCCGCFCKFILAELWPKQLLENAPVLWSLKQMKQLHKTEKLSNTSLWSQPVQVKHKLSSGDRTFELTLHYVVVKDPNPSLYLPPFNHSKRCVFSQVSPVPVSQCSSSVRHQIHCNKVIAYKH